MLPARATMAERVRWHEQHQKHCACRPIPRTVLAAMSPTETSEASSRATTRTADPRFAAVAKALAREPGVTSGSEAGSKPSRAFGSSGLKLDGKLFAMMSSRGQFVAKLPAARVDELVARGEGAYFDPGHGRLMKQWITIDDATSWRPLAREALTYARAITARPSAPTAAPRRRARSKR